MAERIPYGVATSLINTLASLSFKEIASIYGVKSQIEWLKKTVKAIKAVLADADQKQNTEQLIQRWILELKQVLYEADDLLDEIRTKHLRRKRDAEGKGKVRVFLSFSKRISFRRKIARKIRKIKKQFHAVGETMFKLNLVPRVVVEVKHEKSNWRETSSFVRQEDIVGREENKKEIIDLLLTNDSNQNVSLVAVVGIGGLGKTALAQLVYNDADVESFFDKRMWVCVSQDFDVTALVKQILESLLPGKEDGERLDLLQNKLRQNLNGQRYLLVLDDLWNEDSVKWSDLEGYLMCGAEGSKILVTTRDQRVANKMGVKKSYSLKGLTDDQSWTLLKKRLAFDPDKIMSQNLESIGHKIAEKCMGVPLSIIVIGSVLRSKSHESHWNAILEGDFWSEVKNSIMPILRLSYDSLAIELKQCFSYCSLYPKGHRYKKDELIELWMAQGFLENEDEEQCPENIGEGYVHILLEKSFLQDAQTDVLGEIESFKMHDLMHDFSQSIASVDYCLDAKGRKNGARCLINASDSLLNMPKPDRLRTPLSVFKRLRSLNLSHKKMTKLPKSIGKMIHLRYLDLAYCKQLTCLPKSISNLVNLQTLRLAWTTNLTFSKDIITKLINLRRLDTCGCKAFEDGMPIGLGRLTTLQSLSHFIVGNHDKKGKKAKLNELKELNLKGRLNIMKLGLVRDVEEESKDVNLKTKKNLTFLGLSWEEFSEIKNSDPKKLLDNLCPHPNLKSLMIEGYPGVCLSDWLLSCRNLVQLNFCDISNCQYLPALEGFVSLKILYIQGMGELKYICYEECSSSTNFFPSLEKLFIARCRSLSGWKRVGTDQYALPPFLHLSSLDIRDCSNLSCMPTFPNLVRRLALIQCSTKPLLDTLNASAIGPSTSDDLVAPLSKLKSLHLSGIDIEALPEEWMQNLSSLKRLSIGKSISKENLDRHMENLPTRETLTID